jgi:hypothetical protein
LVTRDFLMENHARPGRFLAVVVGKNPWHQTPCTLEVMPALATLQSEITGFDRTT